MIGEGGGRGEVKRCSWLSIVITVIVRKTLKYVYNIGVVRVVRGIDGCVLVNAI